MNLNEQLKFERFPRVKGYEGNIITTDNKTGFVKDDNYNTNDTFLPYRKVSAKMDWNSSMFSGQMTVKIQFSTT